LDGDAAGMQSAAEKATSLGDGMRVASSQLLATLASGRLRQATAMAQEMLRSPDREALRAQFAEGFADLSLRSALLGAKSTARSMVDQSLRLAGGGEASWSLPVTLHLIGQPAEAQAIEAALTARFSGDYWYLNASVPRMHAAAALSNRDYDKALEALAPAQPFERPRPYLSLLRGEALLGAGRPADAVLAFQQTIANRFSVEPAILNPLAHIWLARAHTKTGDTTAARRAYQDAFAMWKDADADLPILVDARKEYAGLK
ncbi:MAG: hypothetical protein ABIS06_08860, partial [Vicinamibacterales bacterium]